jgi:predicted phosphodiesterase
MAARQWPTDEDLLKLAEECGGSPSMMSARLGCASSSLRDHLARRGIYEKVRAATPPPATIKPAPDLGEEVPREEQLEQENAELRRALAKARSEDVKFERVIQAIETNLRVGRSTYKPRRAPSTARAREGHTLVLLWSDQHAAEAVSLEQTNGLNEYSWEIMMRRHDELRRGIASWAERFGPIDTLQILSLGDGLSGNIHEELAETNEMPLSEATVQWGIDAAEWLKTLPDVIPWAGKAQVRVVSVPGNHPRAHKKPRAKMKYDNADWVSSHIARVALSREPWIDFQIPRGARALVEVCGRRILATHGDAVPPSAMVGVPWGGVIRLEAKMRNQFQYDHLAMGHFHEPNLIGNRRIWVNGTIKGDDEYGIERFGGGTTPTQLLIPFHPRFGMVGAQYIDLEPKVVAEAAA